MNPLRKLISGDYPLALTFWGGFLTMVFFSFILARALGYDSEVFHRILITPIAFFFLISIWRSAKKYQGNKIWKNLALFIVAFWAINIALGTVAILFGI